MLIGSFKSAIADIAATTLAAPIMSARISPIAAEGLIDIPPLSNVTPFPVEHSEDKVITVHSIKLKKNHVDPPTKTTGLSFLFPPE
jgi:hypothetical protein